MTRQFFAAAVLALASGPAVAVQQGADHIIVYPGAIAWKDAPAALPPGAKSALLYGDPGKPELFVLRLRFPKGYSISPHTHPRPDVVTVISGRLHLGYGKVADRGRAHQLTAGTFMVTSADDPRNNKPR